MSAPDPRNRRARDRRKKRRDGPAQKPLFARRNRERPDPAPGSGGSPGGALDRLDELDRAIGDASRGDDHAIVCLLLALSPRMEAWACDELGEPFAGHGSQVVTTFVLALADRQLSMPAVRGGALPWLELEIRSFARRLRERLANGQEAA